MTDLRLEEALLPLRVGHTGSRGKHEGGRGHPGETRWGLAHGRVVAGDRLWVDIEGESRRVCYCSE